MNRRTVIGGAVVVMFFGLAIVGCNILDLRFKGQVYISDDAPVDLAVYLNDRVNDQESNDFDQELSDFIGTVLSKPPVPRRPGEDNLDGVQAILADYERHAVYVWFFSNATKAQRQAVIDAVKASPMVERIAKNITPSETPIE